jgi:hypothetical protein
MNEAWRRSGWLIAIGLTGCVSEYDAANPTPAETQAPMAIPADLVGASRVVVRFDTDRIPEHRLKARGHWERRDLELRGKAYAKVREAILNRLGAKAAKGFQKAREFEHLPYMILDITDPSALDALLQDPDIAEIGPEQHYTRALTESLGVIDQPEAAAAGHIGAGTAVAVLDTGADFSLAAFGSCAAPGGACKIAYAQDFAPSDGKRDDASKHGTNVSAIVLGVAPGAKVIALDVFGSGGTASTTDILAAIDWVVANKNTYNISVMNMSLGFGGFTTVCSTDMMAAGIANARDAGILAAIATGNNGYTNKISSPACVPDAVRVGAVYDTNMGGIGWSGCNDATTAPDRVTCFSNSASFIDLLAPGALITAAGIVQGGTSQATPHVAGALAVMRSAYPNDSVDSLVDRLKTTGVQVTDHRNNIRSPRIDLDAAVAASGGGGGGGGGETGLQDTGGGAPSVGEISVDDDDGYVKGTTVTVTLVPPSGATQMCLAAAASCSSWKATAPTAEVSLPAGSGEKTISAWFRAGAGSPASTPLTTTVVVDATKPVDGTLSLTRSNGAITVGWTGFTDANSYIKSYKLVYGTTAPSSCATGTVGYQGSATSATISGLTNGTTYHFRVCALDAVENISTGVATSGFPSTDTVVPTGTIEVGSGWTALKTLPAAITGSDNIGVTQMCVTTATTCTKWVTFAQSANVAVTTSGQTTVRLFLKDAAGNVSAPITDVIGVDLTKPTDGTLTAAGGAASVALTWTAATDAHSGIAKYKVVYAAGTNAPACTVAAAWEGTDLAKTLTGLTNGTTYAVRVCAIDVAGNVSAGKTVTAIARSESVPPTGTVSINAGAEWSASKDITLTLAATDASGVSHMCITQGTTCTNFIPYATSAATKVSGEGTQTVKVSFRDTNGNIGQATDTVRVDTTAPSAGTLTATGSGSTIAVAWSGITDAGSGVHSYKLVYSSTANPGSKCESGEVLHVGTNTSFSHTARSAGNHYYRLCARDNLGTMSAGVTKKVTLP